MTTPDVPHRFELAIEVPGTPEQVWAAIATANGISSWMLPTTLEERDGGHVAFHMGDTSSEGTVTGWDPPRRFAYVEPAWNELAGMPEATVTPLATEFLVEANAGGTCTVRVVSSAFGTGADWENEFWEGMAIGWRPAFDVLRLYLAHFPGQAVTNMSVEATLDRPADEVLAAMVATFGATEVGQPVAGRGVSGVLEQRNEHHLALRLIDPLHGFLLLMASPDVHGSGTWATVQTHLFSPDAAAWVEREEPGWKTWLESLAVGADR